MEKKKTVEEVNREMYGRYTNMKILSIYNEYKIENKVFTLSRIKDGKVLRRFSTESFLPVEQSPQSVGHTPGDSNKEGLQDKHTPLPWDIGYGHNSNSYGIFTKRMLDYGYEEPPICLISPLEQISERDKANAELICKAVNNTAGKGINPETVPDLLEALKMYKNYWDSVEFHGLWPVFLRPITAKIEAAIKKATP